MRGSRRIPRTRTVDRDAFIVDFCRGKSVLHVGMGGFIDDAAITSAHAQRPVERTLQHQLSTVASELVGIDVNPAMLAHMKDAVPRSEYVLADVTATALPAALAHRRFEVVVFSDVIEHLDNVSQALRNLKHLLRPDGQLLLTTVNAYSIDAILKMSLRYESVHEEHTCYFSWSTLRRLLEMNELRIVDFKFYTQDNVTYEGWIHRIVYPITRGISRVLPQFSMGIVAIAASA